MKRAARVGFSQRIRLEWLEYTANLALAGSSRDEIVAALRDRLREKLSVGNEPKWGSRNKAVTILTRVWVTVPPELRALRDDGLDLLRSSEADDRVLVHWCMCMAVYPFFGTVAEAAGRLLRLQGTAGAAQVQRRIRERMGERDTVARAARRILRTFIDWGVLRETGEKGLYRGAVRLAVEGGPPLALWTARAMLSAMGDGPRPVSALLHGPRLFPFDLAPPPTSELEACESLELTRHGLDHELRLGLAKQGVVRD